ncbi:MAG: ATP synthase subunit I [Acidobacteriota bacterium]|nr:ATP synthase subunit I [Acidobacteriota bacterium]
MKRKMVKPEISDQIEEKILRRIPGEIIIFSLIPAIAALIIFDPLTAILVLAGGCLSVISFIWLRQALSKFLLLGRKKALKSAAFLYVLRLLLILAIFSIIIFFFSNKIIAFAVGFSMIIPVFFVEAVVVLSKIKKWKN